MNLFFTLRLDQVTCTTASCNPPFLFRASFPNRPSLRPLVPTHFRGLSPTFRGPLCVPSSLIYCQFERRLLPCRSPGRPPNFPFPCVKIYFQDFPVIFFFLLQKRNAFSIAPLPSILRLPPTLGWAFNRFPFPVPTVLTNYPIFFSSVLVFLLDLLTPFDKSSTAFSSHHPLPCFSLFFRYHPRYN